MDTFHPPLSSFPLPLLSALAIIELWGLFRRESFMQRCGEIMVSLYAASVTAAFLSGYGASEAANQTFIIQDSVIATHHSMGRALLIVAVPLLALKFLWTRTQHGRRYFALAYAALLSISLLLAGYTGFLGGRLVFQHGAGVYAPKN